MVWATNRPRSIYQYSSMAPRLSGQNCKFFKFLLSLNSHKRLTYEKNNTKYRSLTWKPRSHVGILIYRTWPICKDSSIYILEIIAELMRPEGLLQAEPHTHRGKKGNPWVDSLIVIMASRIAHGRVRTTTAVESRKMAAILKIIGRQRHAALVCHVLFLIDDIMLWSTDTYDMKLSADRYLLTTSRAHV